MNSIHTHFGSATIGGQAFLSVLLFGTLWRLSWLHGLAARNPHVRGLARAALTQY